MAVFLQAAAGEQPHEPPDRCRGRHLRRPPRASRGSLTWRPTQERVPSKQNPPWISAVTRLLFSWAPCWSYGQIDVHSSASAPTHTFRSLVTGISLIGAGNLLGFGISAATGSHLHLDLIGTGIFAVAAFATRGAAAGQATRQLLSAGCVGLWATKLSGFLFYRALQTRHDGQWSE